ncbi:MAG: hypothetical protein M1825_005478 [Sarcosagium campestre]|nr:MAG: hypothetical protein M1825_005478 [Sarcosagium campestre]
MESVQKELRRKFGGNTEYYLLVAKKTEGNPVLLQRNLRRTICRDVSANGERAGRKGIDRNTIHRGKARAGVAIDGKKSGKGDVIHKIAGSLAQFDYGKEEPEQWLKLDVKTLRRRLHPGEDTGGVGIGEGSSGSGGNPSSIRCRCELDISHVPRSGVAAKTSDFSIYRVSQYGTIIKNMTDRSKNWASSTIKLDQPFWIGTNDLLVEIEQYGGKKQSIADNYNIRFTFLPVATETQWPPFPIPEVPASKGRLSGRKRGSSLGKVWATLGGLPWRSGQGIGSDVNVYVGDGLTPDSGCFLQIDALWTKPVLELSIRRPPVRSPVPPTSDSGPRQEKVVTLYSLALSESSGENEETRPISRPGYICAFCPDRNLHIAQLLKLHLITAHDLFKYHFTEIDTSDQPEGCLTLTIKCILTSDYDFFEGSERRLHGWAWYQTGDRRRLLAQMVEKASFKPKKVARKTTRPLDPPPPPALPSPQINEPFITNQPASDFVPFDLPRRPRKRHPVPTTSRRVTLFRTATKRSLPVGELVSDSDDDVDETWLRQKHDDIIDDFSDVSPFEKEFIKRWDAHVFTEKITANRYVAQSLLRFARANAVWLARREMLLELWKFTAKLIMDGVIGPECVQACIKIAKAGAADSHRRGERAVSPLKRKAHDMEATDDEIMGSTAPVAESPEHGMDIDRRPTIDLSHPKEPHHGPPNQSPSTWQHLNEAFCFCGKPWLVRSVAICEDPVSSFFICSPSTAGIDTSTCNVWEHTQHREIGYVPRALRRAKKTIAR